MLKIICKKQLGNTERFGHPNMESILEATKKHPDIRPCPEYNGWVEKRWCKNCEFCGGVEEVDDV